MEWREGKGKGMGGKRMEGERKGNVGPTYNGSEGRGKGRGRVSPVIAVPPRTGCWNSHWL